MDVSAPFSWGGYGMIIGEDGATKSVHLILKCPVWGQSKGVDETLLCRQERIQTHELVPVNLLVLARASHHPDSSNSLQGSKQSSPVSPLQVNILPTNTLDGQCQSLEEDLFCLLLWYLISREVVVGQVKVENFRNSDTLWKIWFYFN